MKKEPKVSIVMTTLNRITYLPLAIESILNQTYKNIELIIVIEYSDEQKNIEKIIKKFDDARIKIIMNKKMLGIADSLNTGIKFSTGKYIARMDDDDISVETRIEKQVIFLEGHSSIDIVGSYIEYFGNKKSIDKQPLNSEEIKVKTLFETPLYHPTVMFRKNSFIKNNLFYSNEYITEDFDLWTKAIDKIDFSNLDSVLLKYRISNFSTTLNQQKKIWNSHNEILQKLYKRLFNLNMSTKEIELLRKAFNGWIIHPKDYIKYLNAKKKLIDGNRKYHFCNEKILRKKLFYFLNLTNKIVAKTISKIS